MEQRILRTYVDQVRSQCEFIVMAYAAIRAASARMDEAAALRHRLMANPDPSIWSEYNRVNDATDEAYRALRYATQAMLSAMANVSKVLYGSKTTESARTPIREALKVDDGSAISIEARKMRDHFDHYDERIETWAGSGEGMKISGTGPPLPIEGHTEMALWETYDSSTDTLHFWGDSIDLGAIEAEAQRLIRVIEHGQP